MKKINEKSPEYAVIRKIAFSGDDLNAMFKGGWELVTVVEHSHRLEDGKEGFLLIFKRVKGR